MKQSAALMPPAAHMNTPIGNACDGVQFEEDALAWSPLRFNDLIGFELYDVDTSSGLSPVG